MGELVYIIGPDGGPYKIGRSRELDRRLEGLQTGNPLKLKLFFSVEPDIPQIVELAAQGFLYEHRLIGEWFKCDLAQAKRAIERALKGEQPPRRPRKRPTSPGRQKHYLTGTHIKVARAALRWTLEDLAEAAQISRATAQRMEDRDAERASNIKSVMSVESALIKAGIRFEVSKGDGGPSVAAPSRAFREQP